MKAVILQAPGRIRVEDTYKTPGIEHPRDAVVRVTCSAICGSDLHPYRGEIASFRPDTLLGHEFAGEVVEVGSDAAPFRPGDRVFASDIVACGRCDHCRRGWHYHCPQSTLFGYGNVVGDYVPGGQAEYVRVPNADIVLCHIPEGVNDEQGLFAGDVLTTAFTAVRRAEIARGDIVAVIGCGAVGLAAVMCAYAAGATTVLAVDPHPKRRELAGVLGAVPFAPHDRLAEEIRDEVRDRGLRRIVEAVGSDAALSVAIELAGPRCVICAVGAHNSDAMPFSTRKAFTSETTLRFAVGNPIATRARILPYLADGRLDPCRIVTHRMALVDAPKAYRLFDAGDAVKVVFDRAG